MYLSQLNLWNFRKFGTENEVLDLEKPDLSIPFTKGLNVLIGENDSGKTAIIDAIKLTLKTHSPEWIRLEHEDFYKNSTKLRIECVFHDLSPNEAKNFTEWLGIEGEGEDAKPYLRVIVEARRNPDRILPFEIRAGAVDDGYPLSAEALDYLKTIYLKPLRDAQGELVPKRNSRLSKILLGHEVFKGRDDSHELVGIFQQFSDNIEDYFRNEEKDGNKVKASLETFLKKFFGQKRESEFNITEQKLKNILETLRLTLEDGKLGLGSHNLLFIASELLNLKRTNWDGVRLGLIEELEAHLHPQAQMRVVESLQEQKDVQFILTTHSPNLASKVKLSNLFICENDQVFPMSQSYTELNGGDYKFLERFLDVTKSNLFFAKGVIIIEGWAEEMLLPAFANKIGINLAERGVSIVNVASTALLRYSKIFLRRQDPVMKIPVSVVTDIDVKPEEEGEDLDTKITAKENQYIQQNVKGFISPHWTLEYCLGLSEAIAPHLFEAVKLALNEMRTNGTSSYAEITQTYESQFNGKDQSNIAKEIYVDLIKGKKISKAIIAQQLAIKLEEDTALSKEQLLADDNLQYLLSAIQYAAQENSDQ